jgi:hypothetical protein
MVDGCEGVFPQVEEGSPHRYGSARKKSALTFTKRTLNSKENRRVNVVTARLTTSGKGHNRRKI